VKRQERIPVRSPLRLSPLCLSALAVTVLAALPALATAARMSLVYDEQEAVRALTTTAGPGMPLSAERGLLRQDPGPGGILDPQGRDGQFRVAKISASVLLPLSAEGMANRIRAEIDHPKEPNSSGLVSIDEIGNPFNDGRVRITYAWHTVRGVRIRVSSINKLVITKYGYKVVRGPVPLPRVDPGGPASRLSKALELLSGIPHPAGGNYAERVQFYVAPAFMSSIALGRGPHHNLGNDGKPHRATWRGVMPALARAGGVWLEMYHYTRAGGVTAATSAEWRAAPGVFSRYLVRFAGDPTRLHMMMTEAHAMPPGASSTCGEPMACQWSLADSTGAGRLMLANGPGGYRLGSQATAWRAEFNRLLAP
jgi:hypothetical protein